MAFTEQELKGKNVKVRDLDLSGLRFTLWLLNHITFHAGAERDM